MARSQEFSPLCQNLRVKRYLFCPQVAKSKGVPLTPFFVAFPDQTIISSTCDKRVTFKSVSAMHSDVVAQKTVQTHLKPFFPTAVLHELLVVRVSIYRDKNHSCKEKLFPCISEAKCRLQGGIFEQPSPFPPSILGLWEKASELSARSQKFPSTFLGTSAYTMSPL